MYSVHAGDCRIGMPSEDGMISWMTDVHSLANATVNLDEESLRGHPARNQLTRSFGLKRYKPPEMTEFTCECVGGAVLATDGFWAELPVGAQRAACRLDWEGPFENEDDTSRLIIGWGPASTQNTGSNSRIYVRGLEL